MNRRTLTDERRGRIEGHLPGRAGTRGRSGVDDRLFVDAISWMAGNAARWRDLPSVASMIEGKLRHDTGMEIERRHLDSHGQFAVAASVGVRDLSMAAVVPIWGPDTPGRPLEPLEQSMVAETNRGGRRSLASSPARL